MLQTHRHMSRCLERPRSNMLGKKRYPGLFEALGQMANKSVDRIVPGQSELATQQAADLLNVSRPYLVELLESGRIPSRKVGTHRRVLASDLHAFRMKDDAERKLALDELTAEAQKHGLGY